MKWQYFSPAELRCRCGRCGSTGDEMDPAFMEKLVALREEYGRPMLVTSAYRCPEWNARVSTTGQRGPHTLGRAVDVQVAFDWAYDLVRLALARGFTGLGLRQAGPQERRFVHLDDLVEGDGFSRPRVWTYDV